jgi:hypothetical protein
MKIKKSQYGDYAKWVGFEIMANYQVRVILTEDLIKSAKSRLGSEPGESADAFCYHVKDTGRSYIFLPLDAPESTVVHEAWHIIHRVLTYCHVVDMDDEVVAYHLDHLIEKIYEFKKAVKSSMEVHSEQSKCRASCKKRS